MSTHPLVLVRSREGRPPGPWSRGIRALVVAWLAGCFACGPFGYLKTVAKDASKAVADAKAVGAEQLSPYEYWGAVTYLEQAKILMGYSEYERSFDYGTRAKQLAEEAKRNAERRAKGQAVEADPSIGRPDETPDPAPPGAAGGEDSPAMMGAVRDPAVRVGHDPSSGAGGGR